MQPPTIDADSFRALRKRRGLSLEALAFAAGVSTSTVFRAERGTHLPTAETVEALADALGVEPGPLERLIVSPPEVPSDS